MIWLHIILHALFLKNAIEGQGKDGKGQPIWRFQNAAIDMLCLLLSPTQVMLTLQEMSQEQMEEAMKNASQGQGQDGEGQQIEMSMDMQQPSGEGKDGEEEDA